MEVTNRFKCLDLIECLKKYGWRFITYTGGSDQDHPPRKSNAKKAKWLSDKALQTALKTREAKGKREKERYTHLNAEFQRIAR